ncbi:hypothetical protein V9T40_004198 [Parthenolecanium corni]|uniref:Uncharacterized protein n=1 Tax=Parthenolecanium corni TaxID=536013 RepID=A0AAN9TW68_9HEMI
MTSNGKTTCKEVCSNCKCTIVEKPVQKKEEKKKDQCVATIVGVLQLPENFCCNQPKPEEKKEDDGGQEEEECVDIYRDLGECLQKCIVQSSKGGKQKNGGLECDIGTCGSNGSSKSSKSKNG